MKEDYQKEIEEIIDEILPLMSIEVE